MPNPINIQLLEAMKVIAEKQLDTLKFDKTIEAQIESIADTSTGEYKIRYQDGVFSAYDESLKMSYKIGQTVFVLIPQNDMKLKKIITGKKSTNSSDIIEVESSLDKVDLVGVPLNDIYSQLLSKGEIYGSIASDGIAYYLYKNEDSSVSNADKLFQSYSKDQKNILIQGDFKTDWYIADPLIPARGNYGIEIIFSTIEDKDWSYFLSLSDMTGNPLNYTSLSSQYVIQNIDGNKFKKLKAVRLFAENFSRDGWTEESLRESFSKNGGEIFLSNLKIQYVKVQSQNTYSANILSPKGVYFFDQNSLPLQAQLKYKGEDLIQNESNSKFEYFWFIKDSRISLENENYSVIGGIGWKPLKDKNSAKIDIGYNPSTIIDEYKVVIIYNKEFKANATISVSRTNVLPDFKLELIKDAIGGGDLVISSSQDLSSYGFKWISIDINGKSKTFINNSPKLHVDIYGIFEAETFYCTIYNNKNVDDQNSTYPILTLDRTIYNLITESNFEVGFTTENDGFFMYDENGDVAIEESLTAKELSFAVAWKSKEEEKPFTWQWKFPDDLNKCMFTIPDGQLLQGDSTKLSSLKYNIKSRYDVKKIGNNTIELIIITDGVSYTFYKTLQFTKEGDLGTNGTSFVIHLPYADESTARAMTDTTGIILAPQIYYNGAATYKSGTATVNANRFYKFEVSIPKLYQKQNPLYDSTNDKIYSGVATVKNADSTNPVAKIELRPPADGLDISGVGAYTVVQIKAVPINSPELYPIITYFAIPCTKIQALAQVSPVGAGYIQYDESGYNPRYSEVPYDLLGLNDASITAIDGYGITLRQDSKDKSIYKLQPSSKFTNNLSAYIIFTIGGNGYYYWPILLYANAYSNSILNSWDGSSIDISKEEGYILAPQVGAGKKNDDNTFSGVFLGTQVIPNDKSKTGIVGFNHGISSFGLLDDGTAFIGMLDDGTGKGGGRIEFNSAGEGVIQSSLFQEYSDTATKLAENQNYTSSTGKIGLSGLLQSDLTVNIIDTFGISIANKYQVKPVLDDINNTGYYIRVPYNTILEEISVTTSYQDSQDGKYIKNVSTIVKTTKTLLKDSTQQSTIGQTIKPSESTVVDEKGPSGTIITTVTTIEEYLIYDAVGNGMQARKIQVVDNGDVIILSSRMVASPEKVQLNRNTSLGAGMRIDLKQGTITAADLIVKSKTIVINSNPDADRAISINNDAFYVKHDGTGKFGGWRLTKNTFEAINGRNSIISGGQITGSYIYGTEIDGGKISGSTITGADINADMIYANAGEIAGWTLSNNGFTSVISSTKDFIGISPLFGLLSRDSYGNSLQIFNEQIQSQRFSISREGLEIHDIKMFYFEVDSYYPEKLVKIPMGKVGRVIGQIGGGTDTFNLGIETQDNFGIILNSATEIRLTTGNSSGNIWLDGDIHVRGETHGVYARFA